MNNKNEKPKVLFSAAKFRRLPMAEKLAYLRAALSGLGNGLQVLERRHSAPRNSVPTGETAGANRSRAPRRIPSFARMLSRAQFERLSLEEKRAYLSGAFRELKQVRRRMHDVLTERSAGPLRGTAAR